MSLGSLHISIRYAHLGSLFAAHMTSCAIRGARGGGIGRRSPPGFREELGWAGCGPGGPTWPWPLGR
jgi:hypothetical protein